MANVLLERQMDLDPEWIQLVIQARSMGYTAAEIRKVLRALGGGQQEAACGSNVS